MTERDAQEILDAIREVRTELKGDIKELDAKVDSTRETVAEARKGVAAVEGWAESLNGKLADEVKERGRLAREVSELRAGQDQCPARLASAARNAAEATGQRATIPDGVAVQILAAHPTDPPPVKIARWKAIAAMVGLGIPAIGGAAIAFVELVKLLLSL